MDLITTRIQMERKRGTAATQSTFDEAYNLPDYLPDLFSVILANGEIRLDEVKSGVGQVMVRGGICYHVLYRTEQNEWKIAGLQGEIPFQETLSIEDMDEFDMVSVEPLLEDLSVRISNSRKLDVRALICLQAEVRERYDIDVPVGIDVEEQTEMLYENREFLELCYCGKESCVIREEMHLASNKPNVREILWQQGQVFRLEHRLSAGVLTIQGEISVFLVYVGEENAGLTWFSGKIPFRREFEIPEADSGMIPYIVTRLQNLVCSAGNDADGEIRTILAEGFLTADIRLYKESEQEMLCDSYAINRELILKKQPVLCAGFRMRNESVCRVNDTVRIQGGDSDILQICAGFGSVQLDRKTLSDGGILVEGVVRVSILYLTENDNSPLEAMERTLPFRHLIEIPDLQKSDDVEMQYAVDTLSFLMKNGKEAEIQAVISLQTMAAAAYSTELIREIEEREYDMGVWNTQPSIIGLTLMPGDSLWSIARQFHTTTERIRQLNHLETDDIAEKTKIIIVKEIPARS